MDEGKNAGCCHEHKESEHHEHKDGGCCHEHKPMDEHQDDEN